MDSQNIVFCLFGLMTIGLGLVATLHQGFAEWYVLRSGKGRLWGRILGEERAVKAMRRVFGPLAVIVGVGLLVVALGLIPTAP
ncbi:MAG: hypothetical protein D6795_07310 [Deltaproteobacteria bacterium]|nr:MAG: hypothetical protein D6795_07310 [Deltaproteobacteria bacterium]